MKILTSKITLNLKRADDLDEKHIDPYVRDWREASFCIYLFFEFTPYRKFLKLWSTFRRFTRSSPVRC